MNNHVWIIEIKFKNSGWIPIPWEPAFRTRKFARMKCAETKRNWRDNQTGFRVKKYVRSM